MIIADGINPVRFLLDIKNFIKEMKKVDRVILIGADMLDGFYSEQQSLKRILLVLWPAASSPKPPSLV